jgi:hypothetical protein
VYIELKPLYQPNDQNERHAVLRDGIFQPLIYTLRNDDAISITWICGNAAEIELTEGEKTIVDNAYSSFGLRYIEKSKNGICLIGETSKSKLNKKEPLQKVKDKIREIIEDVKKIEFKKIEHDDYLEEIMSKHSSCQNLSIIWAKVTEGFSGDKGDRVFGESLLYSLSKDENYAVGIVLCKRDGSTRLQACSKTQNLVDKVWEKTGTCWIFKGCFNDQEKNRIPKVE